MISTRSVGLLIDTVVCLTLAKWETVSGRFGGYLTLVAKTSLIAVVCSLGVKLPIIMIKPPIRWNALVCDQAIRPAVWPRFKNFDSVAITPRLLTAVAS